MFNERQNPKRIKKFMTTQKVISTMHLLLLLSSTAFSISLSQFCKSPTQSASITEFDIPFDQCDTKAFTGITLQTNYSTLLTYRSHFRTLRLDHGLTLVVNGVTSGRILHNLDLISATLQLNLAPHVTQISGHIRINKSTGGRLLVNGGSFRAVPAHIFRIIHTNDIHCAFLEKENTIGLPKFFGYLKSQRAAADLEGYSVLALDAGDYIQGQPLCTLTNGSVAIDALIRTGYDAVTIGNHEWDFGHDNAYSHLQSLIANNVSVVCANVNDSSHDEAVNFQPFVIKNINGFRLGIFGLTTPNTPETTSPWKVANVTFSADLVGLSQGIVRTLRADEKCDVVILIAHLGWGFESVDSGFVAECFDGIDLIVDGHSHTELPIGAYVLHNDFQTLVVQTGSSLHNVGVVDLMLDSESGGVVGKRAALLPAAHFAGAVEDQNIKDFLNAVNMKIENITKVAVGRAIVNLSRDDFSTGKSKLGLLIASSMRFESGDGDCALINNGGIRTSINEGLVTWGDMIAVIPFGDQIYVLNASGADLYRIAAIGVSSSDGSAASTIAGLRFTVDLNRNATEDGRILNLTIVDDHGKAVATVEKSRYYKLITTDFLYAGGDGYSILQTLPKIGEVGGDLDALADFIRSLPNQEITDSLSIYESGGYDIVGKTLRKASVDRSVRLKSITDDGADTVVISEAFNAMDLDSHGKDGVWAPFYEYRLKAQKYIAKNVSVLKAIVEKDVGYVSVDGVIVAGGNRTILVASGLDAEPKTIEGNITGCGSFYTLNNEGGCVINGGMVAAVVLACVFGILVLASVVFCVRQRCLRQQQSPTHREILQSSFWFLEDV
jgi:5'-nucleotidase